MLQPPANDVLFDAVLFDLDGTLVASELHWPDAARAAALAFRARPGVPSFPLPTGADWLAMRGQPPEEALEEMFPGLAPDLREELFEACEAEAAAQRRGVAAVLPGAREALGALRAAGIRVGVASNCGRDYLDAMVRGLGLDQWVEEARCLQSPGISDKADMVQDLILTFGTRSAVMVGDRSGDRSAAWANGLPFVHVARAGDLSTGDIAAEARIEGLDELVPALGRRAAVLDEVLRRTRGAESIAVSGGPLSGTTLFTRDLARRAPAGVAVVEEREGDPPTPGAFRVHTVSVLDVLVRRAKGMRTGPGPVEDLLERGIPRATERGIAAGALVVDLTNPIAPVLASS